MTRLGREGRRTSPPRILTLTLLTTVLLAGGAWSSLAGPPQGAEAEQARAMLRARDQAVLSSDIAGRILTLAAREGESFRAGQRLIEFDCALIKAAAASAQASVGHAQAKLNSLETMAAHRATGTLELALARADLDKARAEARAAALQVERCVITAPFSGRVVEVRTHPFESVGPNTPLLAILNDTALEVSLVIPSSWLAWLKPGQTFTLTLDETRTSHPGRIARLGAQVDPVSQTVTVYGTLTTPATGLIAGMSGTASFVRP